MAAFTSRRPDSRCTYIVDICRFTADHTRISIVRRSTRCFAPPRITMRVIGVVLSGALDNGSAGLRAVKQGGGIDIVQHPSDARVAAMPSNAMEHVDVDHAVAAADLAPLLLSLVQCEGELALRGEVALETVEEASVADEACRSDELGVCRRSHAPTVPGHCGKSTKA